MADKTVSDQCRSNETDRLRIIGFILLTRRIRFYARSVLLHVEGRETGEKLQMLVLEVVALLVHLFVLL